MTMHLHHPGLSLSGKKKGKVKFRNADEARKARELDASWKELQKKWNIEAEETKRKRALSAKPLVYSISTPNDRSTKKIASKDTGWVSCVKSPDKTYTGSNMLGIGQMHKSNAVPIFKQSDAEDIAKMRR